MAIDRLEVTNYDLWGKLVKTWATGDDYIQDGTAYPIPKTLQEFTDQLARAGVGATIPARIKAIQFIQSNLETQLVRLPPREAIKDSEAQLVVGGAYPLPPFYRDAFGGAPTIPDNLKFHAQRIGDYTMGLCM